jgi:hypothetical protein
MTDLEILQLLVKAKELGLSMLDVEAYKQTPAAYKDSDILQPVSPLDELTEEEITYWSTPYYEELQALRLRRKEADDSKDRVGG